MRNPKVIAGYPFGMKWVKEKRKAMTKTKVYVGLIMKAVSDLSLLKLMQFSVGIPNLKGFYLCIESLNKRWNVWRGMVDCLM